MEENSSEASSDQEMENENLEQEGDQEQVQEVGRVAVRLEAGVVQAFHREAGQRHQHAEYGAMEKPDPKIG